MTRSRQSHRSAKVSSLIRPHQITHHWRTFSHGPCQTLTNSDVRTSLPRRELDFASLSKSRCGTNRAETGCQTFLSYLTRLKAGCVLYIDTLVRRGGRDNK